jgi:spore coat polysaccharide biosynthesis protein SpsF
MLKNLGIVQACFGRPRFQANVSRRVDGRPLLEWVLRRATESLRLDGVIVLACGSCQCDLARLVPSDVPVLMSEGDDAMARFARALEVYPAEAVVRIQGDNLFIDPELIDRLITMAEGTPDCDYAGYRTRAGRPAEFASASLYPEWFRTSALRRANRLATAAVDREAVTRAFFANPQKFNVCLLPAPAEIDRDDVRLTVDIEEDWDHAITIIEAIGVESLDWRRIARLLDHQPALRSRMAALNRVHAGVE